MKIAVLGGGGAMGGLFGGYLARAGEDVTLVDVSRPAVDAINRDGVSIEERDGSTASIKVKASSVPAEVGTDEAPGAHRRGGAGVIEADDLHPSPSCGLRAA